MWLLWFGLDWSKYRFLYLKRQVGSERTNKNVVIGEGNSKCTTLTESCVSPSVFNVSYAVLRCGAVILHTFISPLLKEVTVGYDNDDTYLLDDGLHSSYKEELVTLVVQNLMGHWNIHV